MTLLIDDLLKSVGRTANPAPGRSLVLPPGTFAGAPGDGQGDPRRADNRIIAPLFSSPADFCWFLTADYNRRIAAKEGKREGERKERQSGKQSEREREGEEYEMRMVSAANRCRGQLYGYQLCRG